MAARPGLDRRPHARHSVAGEAHRLVVVVAGAGVDVAAGVVSVVAGVVAAEAVG